MRNPITSSLRLPVISRGFGLVELMVGVVIGMLGILVVMQVFAVAEQQRRTATSGAGAQFNGLLGMFSLERDVRMTGFGSSLVGCTTIRTWDDTRTPAQSTMPGIPLTITQNTPSGTTNDEIRVFYSASPYSAIPAVVQDAMPESSSILHVDMGRGFHDGDFAVLSQPPKDCTLIHLTEDGQATGAANTTGPGTRWNLQHNPASDFNPPNSTNLFPAGGYTTGAKVINLGALVHRAYYVENSSLMVRDLRAPAGPNNPLAIASGVFALRAVFGRDTNDDGAADEWNSTAPASANELVALRVGIVTRSGEYEKEQVSPSTLTLWSGGPTVTLREDTEADPNNRDRHYRYKIYQTTIPLRNVIWGKA